MSYAQQIHLLIYCFIVNSHKLKQHIFLTFIYRTFKTVINTSILLKFLAYEQTSAVHGRSHEGGKVKPFMDFF